MADGNHERDGTAVTVICPSCDGSLGLERELLDGVEEGGTIRAFCAQCQRTAEITAPQGVETVTQGVADTVPTSPLTEFPATNHRGA